MEKLNKPTWDPLRDERLDLPPQPKYAPRFPHTPIWSSIEKATPNLRAPRINIESKGIPYSPKPEIGVNFPELKKRITDLFRKDLKLEPTSITLHRSPEDGEERIIVTVPLGKTDDPLEAILSIKRQLRKIDSNLASNIVVLPSD